MRLNFLLRFQYKLRRKIILRLHEQMERFGQSEIEIRAKHFRQVKKIERRFAILETRVETFSQPIIYSFLFLILLFVITAPFFSAYKFGVQSPIVSALIFFVPYAILSIVFYQIVSYGSWRHIEWQANLPMTDKISNASKWTLISALISVISTSFFSPLASYIILTPIVVGVGSAILFLGLEIITKFILEKFIWAGFYKKFPHSTVSHLFVEIATLFDVNLPDSYLYQLELAQLLGDTAELMQRLLPSIFTRIDRTSFVFEISDPYINKLIELRVAEMAMTLRVLAKIIILDRKKGINYAQNKVEKNFIAVLDYDWENYQVEKSDDTTALIKMPPLTTKTDLILDKLKFVFTGFLPLILLYLLQNTNYALSDKIFDNIFPFVITWALVSLLNLFGSDDIIDRMLKVKGVVSSFGGSTK